MPVRKEDAHRALELLQEYRSRLSSPTDRPLVSAIDRVIHVFQSRLFQALLDIREFYEVTLLDDTKSTEEKTQEAMGIAQRWERHPNFPAAMFAEVGFSQQRMPGYDTNEISPSVGSEADLEPPVNGCRPHVFHDPPVHGETVEEVVLERNNSGYGFSIAGGVDNPHVPHDTSIYITRITPGGVVSLDGRLRVNDVILSVNNENVVEVTHGEAVDALKRAGKRLTLIIRRRPECSPSPSPIATVTNKSSSQPGLYQPPRHSTYPEGVDGGGVHAGGMAPRGSASGGSSASVASAPAMTGQENQWSASTNSAREVPQKQHHGAGGNVLVVKLVKGQLGLGFSIAGGRGNEHVIDDPGIFITKLIDQGAAMLDGRIEIGDRLVQVNDTLLADVTHEEAVEALKKTGETVMLTFLKPPPGRPPRYVNPGPPLTPSDSGDYHGTNSSGHHYRVNNNNNYGSHQNTNSSSTTTGSISRFDRMASKGMATPFSSGIIHDSMLDNDTSLSRFGKADSVTREPRLVVLYKGANGLGFNIVGGESEEGIFVSHLQPRGPAHLSGLLHRGDRLLRVNNVDVSIATHEDAASALKGASERVEIVVQYCPEDYAAYEMDGRAPSPSSASAGQTPQYSSGCGDNDSAGSGTQQHLLSSSHSQQQYTQNSLNSNNNSGTVIPVRHAGGGAKRSLYVRTQFDYDPAKDSGLPNTGLAFRFGDILHVTNPCDDEWWQARRVSLSTGEESRPGVVPSKRRVERRERARLKRVNFEGGGGIGIGGSTGAVTDAGNSNNPGWGSLEKKKTRGGSLLRKFNLTGSRSTRDIEMVAAAEDRLEEPVLSYELVVQDVIDYTRPIVNMGPLKDKINDDLISEFPDRFGSCVPHTTRPKRDYEVDGRDYHFVSSREAMERDIRSQLFIEAGQYQGNLYGTSAASVWAVARAGKHCILDVSGNALRRLRSVGLHPVAVLVRASSPAHVKRLCPRLSEDQASRAYERAVKLETDFAQYFTAMICEDSYQAVYARVKEVIREQSGSIVWSPVVEQV